MASPKKIIRRFRADLELSSTAAVVDVADALAVQYPDLTREERLLAAQRLFQEIARRLRDGQVVSFAKKNDDDTYDISLAHIEALVPDSLRAKRR